MNSMIQLLLLMLLLPGFVHPEYSPSPEPRQLPKLCLMHSMTQGGSKYYLLTEPVSLYSADEACDGRGLNLATIATEDDYHNVLTFIGSQSVSRAFVDMRNPSEIECNSAAECNGRLKQRDGTALDTSFMNGSFNVIGRYYYGCACRKASKCLYLSKEGDINATRCHSYTYEYKKQAICELDCTTSDSCPNVDDFTQVGNKYYSMAPNDEIFSNAEQTCNDTQQVLATIFTQSDYQNVESFINQEGSDSWVNMHNAWGNNCENQACNGNFLAINDSVIDLSHVTKEMKGKSEMCVKFKHDGKLHGDDCATARSVVCETDCGESLQCQQRAVDNANIHLLNSTFTGPYDAGTQMRFDIKTFIHLYSF